MTSLRERAAWTALEHHYAEVRDVHLRDLFAEDPTRGERLAAAVSYTHLTLPTILRV